ncbi:hypothetical protein JRI60_24215 [Archangium violaceum]|uniref:hypothetical protein n=1 Tax=Archangium violaceum TaxID=83451 RepID=UPI001951459C|nr:hypothetical protein [Archangium violaceum]QRO01900.1 hypothetical protein JRI60_24215 [Archangium violaceum]
MKKSLKKSPILQSEPSMFIRRSGHGLSVLAVGLAALLCWGCGGDTATEDVKPPTPGRGNVSRLSAINVVNARALFVAETSTAHQLSNGDAVQARKLFKITESGAIQEVTYRDEAGLEVTDIQTPVAVYNASRDYVIVCFGSDIYNLQACYLVAKGDGTAFSLELAGYPLPQQQNFINSPTVTSDTAGNLYYLARDNDQGRASSPVVQLIRLDVQDPLAIKRTVHTPVDEEVFGFAVDPAGNVLYAGYSQGDARVKVSRLKKLSGGFFNLPAGMTSYWVDLEGRFAYWSFDAKHIQRLGIDANNNVSVGDYGTTDISTYAFSPTSSYQIRTSNRLLLVSTWDANVQEVYNPSGTPRRVEGLPLAMVKRVAETGDSYYLSGNDKNGTPLLIKVDATTDAVSNLLPPGEYDVSEMAAAPDGELTFNALRMSDGARIIGRISPSGTVSVLDATLDARVIVLEPIQ